MKGKRRKSREAAIQALYQWKLAGGTAYEIESHFRESEEYAQCDAEYFTRLLKGTIAEVESLQGIIRPNLDRDFSELSPVEASILLLGTFELKNHPDIPYRVVINEAVELAKLYGGTDGHKYVNGVLDRIAAKLRASEIR